MADEVKVAEKKENNKSLAMIIKVIVGVVLLGLGVWALIGWFYEFKTIMKGCAGPFLLLAALITFAIAKE